MGRIPRRYLLGEEGGWFHVTWKVHNDEYLLGEERVKQKYLELLRRYKTRYGIKIVSYTIMDNHVHMTLYAPSLENLWRFMQVVNSVFARWYNKLVGRRGSLVRERYHASRIGWGWDIRWKYLLHAIIYDETNAHKAGMTNGNIYKWSSAWERGKGERYVIDDVPCEMKEEFGGKEGWERWWRGMVMEGGDRVKELGVDRTYALGEEVWVSRFYDEIRKKLGLKRGLVKHRRIDIEISRNVNELMSLIEVSG